MNLRPSTSLLASSVTQTANPSARSLRFRLVSLVGLGAVVVLGIVAAAGLTVLKRSMADDEDARITNAASLSKQLVDRVLAERARQVELIASSPSVIAAAKKGAAEQPKSEGSGGKKPEEKKVAAPAPAPAAKPAAPVAAPAKSSKSNDEPNDEPVDNL